MYMQYHMRKTTMQIRKLFCLTRKSMEVQQAIESMKKFGLPEESWNMLVPQQQQWEYEDRSEGNTDTMSV